MPFLLSLETGEGWLDHEPSSLKSKGACVGHFVTVIEKKKKKEKKNHHTILEQNITLRNTLVKVWAY